MVSVHTPIVCHHNSAVSTDPGLMFAVAPCDRTPEPDDLGGSIVEAAGASAPVTAAVESIGRPIAEVSVSRRSLIFSPIGWGWVGVELTPAAERPSLELPKAPLHTIPRARRPSVSTTAVTRCCEAVSISAVTTGLMLLGHYDWQLGPCRCPNMSYDNANAHPAHGILIFGPHMRLEGLQTKTIYITAMSRLSSLALYVM